MHTRSRLLCTFVTEAASVCMADEKSGQQNRAMRCRIQTPVCSAMDAAVFNRSYYLPFGFAAVDFKCD